MAYKINPFTGNLDISKIPLLSYNAAPTLTSNGDIVTAFVDPNGRIYFRANDNTYYIDGSQVISLLFIAGGQPIGLMGVTYAEDVN